MLLLQVQSETADVTKVIIGSLFVLMLVVVYWTLGRTPFKFGLGRLPFAIAFSLLCVMGLQRPGRSTEPAKAHGSWIDFILLPYEAFAITILLLPLVFLLARWWARWSRSPKKDWGPGDKGEGSLK